MSRCRKGIRHERYRLCDIRSEKVLFFNEDKCRLKMLSPWYALQKCVRVRLAACVSIRSVMASRACLYCALCMLWVQHARIAPR